MREVKFRAWDSDFEEMLEVKAIIFDSKTLIPDRERMEPYILDEHNDVHYLSDIELMQYTNCLDNEEKEIYEGDIVRKEFVEQYLEDKVLVGEVKMIEGMWVVVNDKEKVAEPLWNETDMNYVIGNIYENKELLED